MRRIGILFVWLVLTAAPVWAQKGVVEQMRQHKAEIERQIAASKKLLTNTDNSITSQLASVNMLANLLSERRKLLEQTKLEIRVLEKEAEELTEQLSILQKEYEECQERYAAACQFYQKQHSSFNPLLFLFSSRNYRQLSRRFRYVKEYSSSVTDLAEEIAVRKEGVQLQKEKIDSVMQEKLALQEQQAEQEKETRSEEQRQRSLLGKLQSKRSSLKKEIDRQQKEMNALSKEIDRQIELALKEAQKAAQKEAQAKSQKSDGKSKSTQMTHQTEADVRLTGSFESNKGKLPIPITGDYLIVGNYGVQSVAGMSNVKMNNLGIDIQGNRGAQARAVYDGTVSTVFQQGKGQIGVLVRHGSYISVYCNLSASRVSKGAAVKTGDIIGDVASDTSGRTILHFQLHKESTKLNPSLWLKK